MSEMQAWILDESPGGYRWGTIERPEPGPDDVAVRPVASALNHMDLWVTTGQPRPKLPHVPGCDVAGVVEAVGTDVTTVAVGDEVVVNPAVSPLDAIVRHGNDSPLGKGFEIVGEQRWGGHAERVVVPSRNIVPRPAGRSWAECAAYPLATLTAWRMLRRARLSVGETLLVVGIGGGVSMAALALGRQLGAEVHVTSRERAKVDAAIAQGAVAGYDSSADWPVKADVVVESVGPATWDRSVKALVPGGRLVVCGGTSGQKVEVNLPKLFFKQIEIIGSTMGSYEEFDQVTRLMAQGLPVAVDQELDLAAYPGALERLKAGDQLGKVVLHHPSR
jgi:NADPH:quinone reductase-like Zn-dependent oxidoreductase